MHNETALLRRARRAYELGRLRDAAVKVGWVFLAIAIAAAIDGWSPPLTWALVASLTALGIVWRGHVPGRPLMRLAPLLLLLVVCWPLVGSC